MRGKHQKFSVVELLVVMAILVILVAITASATVFLRQKAKRSRVRAQISQIRMALEQYQSESGFFPEQSNTSNLTLKIGTINALTNEQGKRILPLRSNPLFSETKGSFGSSAAADDNNNNPILDAYGNPIYYHHCRTGSCSSSRMNKKSYDLWSMGTDGKHGDGGSSWTDAMTPSENDDVTNWKND